MNPNTAVLNVSLYNALCRHFGEDGVEVRAEGESIDWCVIRFDAFVSGTVSRPRRKVRNSGEEYVVKCPFCKDHRARLWINHRWGRVDPTTGKRNLWLAQCWNEQCLADYKNQKQLFKWIYEQGGASDRAGINPGEKVSKRKLCEVPPAGTLVPLTDLIKYRPDHHALVYLRARFFDPAYLCKRYGVCYCDESRYMHAQDRIYIPVRHEDKLVGWQCRYIGDDVGGRPFNEMGIPKYYTCPGMGRRHIAYNMELAMRHPTIVIVEGATDVWSFGPMAMGLLSKKMAQPLVNKIAGIMQERWGDEAAVAVMLDPEWDDQAVKKNKHPIHVLARQFRQTGMKTVPVWLPDGTDPGSLDNQLLRGLVKERAKKLKVRVTFSRRPCKQLQQGG